MDEEKEKKKIDRKAKMTRERIICYSLIIIALLSYIAIKGIKEKMELNQYNKEFEDILKKIKIGMDKEEVIKLIGEPNVTSGFGDDAEKFYHIHKNLKYTKYDEIKIEYDEKNKVKNIIRVNNQEIDEDAVLWDN